jgi:hypothetical protein
MKSLILALALFASTIGIAQITKAGTGGREVEHSDGDHRDHDGDYRDRDWDYTEYFWDNPYWHHRRYGFWHHHWGYWMYRNGEHFFYPLD